MKEGLILENHHLIYYENGRPKHAGVIKVDGAFYYISSRGRAVKGRKGVHREMANGLLERGIYTFGDDYKLVEGSYIPIKRQRGYRIKSVLHRLKKNKTVKKVFKKKNIFPTLAVLLSVCLLVILLKTAESEIPSLPGTVGGEGSEATGESIDDKRIVVLPSFDEAILLSSTDAKCLYDNQCSVASAVKSGDPYRPVVFSYQFKGVSGTLLLSEDAYFTDAKEYALPEKQESISIDNLKTATTYYYRVLVGEEVYESSFNTAASTRFVSIPGLSNTRDIGGYVTQDGRIVKQGLLIRGLELDGLVEPTYFIPKDSIEDVKETFGFVYDFDLRADTIFNGENYQTRLGDDVGHKFYNAPQYGGIFHEANLPLVKTIFQDLADPEKYPMYFHCSYGTDRTGTMVFLLQGLLNMSEEDMVREYRLTAFFNPPLADSDNMDIIIEGMKSYAGDTLQERIETYFIEAVGITEAEIESIRSIFLE